MSTFEKIADSKVLFQRWFGNAIKKLEEMENQDGGTAGMMIVLPLYERYVQINSKKSKQNWLVYMANDLTLKARPEAVIFWTTFRHGFCHLAMPLEVARNRKPLPKARFSTDFSWRPTFVTEPGNQQLICLDSLEIYSLRDGISTTKIPLF